MSRYDLVPRDRNHTVCVSWDNPMSTFFPEGFPKHGRPQID
jgi:hypothetical protein